MCTSATELTGELGWTIQLVISGSEAKKFGTGSCKDV